MPLPAICTRRPAVPLSLVLGLGALAVSAVVAPPSPMRAAAAEPPAKSAADAAAGAYTVTVLRADGKPAAGARVWAVPAENWDTPATALTADAAGRVTVPSGPFFVLAHASAPGGALAVEAFTGTEKGPRTLRLSAPDAEDGVATGKVVDADGKPLAGVRVAPYVLSYTATRDAAASMPYNGRPFPVPEPLMARFATTTAADGTFRIAGLPPGNHNIVLSDPRWAAGRGAWVQVPGDPKSTDGPLVAKPAGSLSGRVVGPDGKPLAGVRVMAHGQYVQEGSARALSGPDGAYTLTSLPPGRFNVTAEEPTGRLVAAAQTAQLVSVGKTGAVPPLAFSAGALIVGRLVDADTKQPLKGSAGLHGPHRPQDGGGNDHADTDADGTFWFRVPAGISRVWVMSKPDEYQRGGDAVPVTLKAGETRRLDLPIKKGLTLSGVLVDDAGKPIAERFVRAERGPFDEAGAMTDGQGRFTIKGLSAGAYDVRLSDESEEGKRFALADAPKVTLPRPADAAPLRLVRKAAAPARRVAGRVVDRQGNPVPGVTVKVDAAVWKGEYGHGVNLPPATTDADGRYEAGPLPAEARVHAVSVEKKGWAFHSGGKVTEAPNGTAPVAEGPTVEEFVMTRLAGRIVGSVVDAAGKPVAGARVLSLTGGGAGARTVSDARGRFALTDLPEGRAEIIAGKAGAGIATAEPSTGGPPPILTLEKTAPPAGPDLDRAERLIESALRDSAGKQYYARTWLPLALAPYAPDRAAKLAEGGRMPPWAARAAAEQEIETASSPARTADALLAKLESYPSAGDRIRLLLKMSRRLEKSDPMKARGLYARARTEADARPGEVEHYLRAHLAAAAARAGDNARAEADLAESLRMVDTREDEKQRDGIRGAIAELLGEEDALALAEKVLPTIRGEEDRAAGYSRAISGAASVSPSSALRLLEKAEAGKAFGGDEGGFRAAQARRKVAAGLATRDIDAALAVARAIEQREQKGEAFLAIAARLPKEKAAALHKEAATLLGGSWEAAEKIARAGRDLAATDPALGRGLLATARELAEEQARRAESFGVGDPMTAQRGRVSWAFYAAATAPEEARLTLESVAAILRRDPKAGWDQVSVALAMAAVDPDRAEQMANALPSGQTRWEAQRKLAQWSAAPPAVRRTIPLDRWSASDTWTPGTPTGW